MASLKTLLGYSEANLIKRAQGLGFDLTVNPIPHKPQLAQAIFECEQRNQLIDPHQDAMNRAENEEMEQDEANELGVDISNSPKVTSTKRKAGSVSSMKSVRNIVRKLVDQAIAKKETAFFATMVNNGVIPFTVSLRVECDQNMGMRFDMGPKEGDYVTCETDQEKAYRVLGSTLGFEQTAATAEHINGEETDEE